MKCNLEKYFSLEHVIRSVIILTKTSVTYDQIYLRTENHIKSLFVMFLRFDKCVIVSDKGHQVDVVDLVISAEQSLVLTVNISL